MREGCFSYFDYIRVGLLGGALAAGFTHITTRKGPEVQLNKETIKEAHF